MKSANYMVPDHGFGNANYIPIQEVNPDFLVDLMEKAGTDQPEIKVNLSGSSKEGFRVRYQDTTIGHLEKSDVSAYTELDWIIDAGLHPLVTARIAMVEMDGERWPSFDVQLPAPGLCVPANNPPAERWALLPGSTPATITNFQPKMDVFPEEAQHFLVTLRARRFLRHRAVAVLVDGVQIASLDREDTRRLADTVLEYQQNGLLAVARAYYCMEDSKPRLVVYADTEDTAKRAVVVGTLTAASMGLSAVAAARAEAAEHASIRFFGYTNKQAAALMTSQTASTTLIGSNVGLKLGAAASTAVILGGGANLATSLFSLDKQEREATAAVHGESFDDSSFQDESAPYRDIFGMKSHSSSSVATAPGAGSRGGFRAIEEDSDSASNKNGHRNVATRIQAKDAIEPTPEPKEQDLAEPLPSEPEKTPGPAKDDVPQVTETTVVLPAPRTTAHRESKTASAAPSVEVTTAPPSTSHTKERATDYPPTTDAPTTSRAPIIPSPSTSVIVPSTTPQTTPPTTKPPTTPPTTKQPEPTRRPSPVTTTRQFITTTITIIIPH